MQSGAFDKPESQIIVGGYEEVSASQVMLSAPVSGYP